VAYDRGVQQQAPRRQRAEVARLGPLARQSLRVLAALVRGLLLVLGALAWLLILRAWEALLVARALGPRELARRGAVLLGRIVAFAVTATGAFVLVTALVGRSVHGAFGRWALGALVVLSPLLLFRSWRRLPSRGMATACNAMVVLVVLVWFGRDAGSALRRRGDWFLGYRKGPTVAAIRGPITSLGWLLERFEPPAKMTSYALPVDPNQVLFGPWLPGQPPDPPPREPIWVRWYHPLAIAERSLPNFESRRFGGIRPGARPGECEKGHCGVDLGAIVGEPVFAVADGVVERVERNAGVGGRAGRYVRIGHLAGRVVTRYLHLDSIRNDLRVGSVVAAGELIGSVGRTGVTFDFPHLHFGLSLRTPGSGERYFDPEPFLRLWDLIQRGDSRSTSSMAGRSSPADLVAEDTGTGGR
jgi:Peptidase family M23